MRFEPSGRENRQAVGDIEKLCRMGQPLATMYADYRFATVNGEKVKDIDQ